MQNTRLNSLVDFTATRIANFFGNPWRRISLVLIALLMGVFLGTAIPTTAGQTAEWDVITAGALLLFTELVSRFNYSRNRPRQTVILSRRYLIYDVMNAFKIGLTYSLFIEAFKLGS